MATDIQRLPLNRRTIAAGLALLTLLTAALFVMINTNKPASAAASDVISGYKDSFRLTTAANQQVQVGRLSLPQGSYTISAKLYTGPPMPSGYNTHVRCVLSTLQGDFDQTMVNHDGTTAFVPMVLNVVHRYTASGSVVLTCGHDFTAGDTYLYFVKITAIQANAVTNIRLP
jgi:hypothetical protein